MSRGCNLCSELSAGNDWRYGLRFCRYPTVLVLLFSHSTRFDDLIDYTELKNVHDEGKEGHDKHDLDRGREGFKEGVTEAKEGVGYSGKGEREQDKEFHDDD